MLVLGIKTIPLYRKTQQDALEPDTATISSRASSAIVHKQAVGLGMVLSCFPFT